jgi:molecular chaperone HscB
MSPNYFELFELPVSFEVNKDTLSQRFRDLQRKVHPDKYVNAPERERRLAMQQVTLVNEAFQTLKNPLSRARYLLQLQGINVQDETNTVMATEFLLQQMELREELAEIRQGNQPLELIKQLLTRIDNLMQPLFNHLSQQLSQQEWQLAHKSLRQLQFFQRLREEALNLEEELLCVSYN